MRPRASTVPVHVVVMAKAPVAGQAKTRLIPALGRAGAARLAQALWADTVQRIQALQRLAWQVTACAHAPDGTTAAAPGWGLTVEWCLTPGPTDAAWLPSGLPGRPPHEASTGLAKVPSNVWPPRPAADGVLTDQGQGDLGQRMARPCQRADLARRAVMLVGTDCPLLSPALMWQAACALQHHDAALIPATDGGYVLLGLRQHCPAVFADMPWSTEAVAGITLSRLHARGYTVWQGPCLPDVDDPADLPHLPPAFKPHLPPTDWPTADGA